MHDYCHAGYRLAKLLLSTKFKGVISNSVDKILLSVKSNMKQKNMIIDVSLKFCHKYLLDL